MRRARTDREYELYRQRKSRRRERLAGTSGSDRSGLSCMNETFHALSN